MRTRDQLPRTAIVIAGGEGTRLRPLTYELPKPLVPIFGKPLIAYSIEEMARNGIEDAVLAIGYKAEKIVEYFEKNKEMTPVRIRYSIEKEKLGTGGAIKLAMSIADGHKDLAVINGDNLFRLDFAAMYKRHLANKALVTIAIIRVDNVKGSGVVVLDGERVTQFVEKPDPDKAPSHFISCGIYIISSRIAKAFPDADAFSFEKDVLEKLAAKEQIYAYPAEVFYTVNDHEQYRKAEEALKQHKV